MNELELMWLAGLLEGEGSFLFPPPCEPTYARISLQMTDEDVVKKAARLMGIAGISVHDRKPGIWKPTFQIQIKGCRARKLMERLLPHMGQRRAERIKAVLAATKNQAPGENTRKLEDEQVAQIYRRCQSGESTEKIATEYGVSGWLVRRIRAKKYRAQALSL